MQPPHPRPPRLAVQRAPEVYVCSRHEQRGGDSGAGLGLDSDEGRGGQEADDWTRTASPWIWSEETALRWSGGGARCSERLGALRKSFPPKLSRTQNNEGFGQLGGGGDCLPYSVWNPKTSSLTLYNTCGEQVIWYYPEFRTVSFFLSFYKSRCGSSLPLLGRHWNVSSFALCYKPQ